MNDTLTRPGLLPDSTSRLTRAATSWWGLATLAAVLLAIHLNGLGVPPLAGTEGHRVITAHQMNQRGEYLIPRLYGFPYLLKPPLYYWVLAGFERAFGSGPWVWRMTSVASHLGVIVACWAFGRRWFGAAGGAAAGFGFVLMVCLWQEARSADIDALNTLLSTLAALGLTDLLLRPAGQPVRWGMVALTALALGAALLAKLPGVIPALLVPLAGGVVVDGVRPALRRLLRREVAAVFAGAAGLFLAWGVPLRLAMRGQQTVMDNDGLAEARRNLMPHSLGDVLDSLLLPATLWAYALPASVAVLFAFHRAIWGHRREAGTPERTTSVLAGGLIGAWLLLTVVGQNNPRYAYVTTPAVAVLAGGVFPRLYRERRGDLLAGLVVAGSAVALAVAAVVLCVQVARMREYGPVPVRLWVSVGCAAAGAAAAAYATRRAKLPAAAVLTLAVAVATAGPFAEYCNRRRDLKSGIHAARQLDRWLPPGAEVTVGNLLYFQPEIFLYLARPVEAVGKRSLDRTDRLSEGKIYVLDQREYQALAERAAARPEGAVLPLPVREFRSNGARCYLVGPVPK